MIQPLRRVGNVLTTLWGMKDYLDEALAVLPLLRSWNALTSSWGTPTGLKERLLIISQAVGLVTSQTATTLDDALQAEIEKLANNDAMMTFASGLLAQFFAKVPDATPAQAVQFLTEGENSQELAQLATENQISWPMIVEAFKLITALIALFRNMASDPGTGTVVPPTAPTAPDFGF